MADYFDLHVHPTLKHFLSGLEMDDKKNCWDTYRHPVGIVRSQSSFEQMKFGNVRLAVIPLYAMEKVFSTIFLTRYVAPILTFLDDQMMSTLPTANYFDRLQEEIRFLEKHQDFDKNSGKVFKIIKSFDEFDPQKLNLILAIEGGHCLEKSTQSLTQSLDDLKRGPYRFLYLNLTHFIRFDLCTQAYGMKLIKKNDILKPWGSGLTEAGKQIIDKAYLESAEEKPLLIDVKHMSLASRKQFYEYRKQKGYEHIPIMASHIGVTGISWDPESVKKYIRKKKVTANGHFVEVIYSGRPQGIGKSIIGGGRGRTFFNPWSINLYDEDIQTILDSGGRIGLILDQRILGAQKVKGEFFSKQEFEPWMEDRIKIEEGEFEEDEPLVLEVMEEDELEEDELSVFNKRLHLRHLCNTILHIVKVGGARAWKQLCIGSDFDGLIDPINSCTSCAQFDKLEEDLVDMLGKMIGEAQEEDPSAEFFKEDLKEQVRDVMYENGLRFLRGWFV